MPSSALTRGLFLTMRAAACERWGAGALASMDGSPARGKSRRPPKEFRAAAMAGSSERMQRSCGRIV